MKYLFPLRILFNFSQKNKNATYGVFLLCLMIAISKGHFDKNIARPHSLIGFFDQWTGPLKNLFVTIIELLYTPSGMILWLMFVFMLFLWLLRLFSGLRSRVRLSEFIFSFLSLCYFALLLWAVSLMLTLLASAQIPYLIRLGIFSYWCLFYIIILIEKHGLKLARAIVSMMPSFLIAFMLGGFPGIAPYLQGI